MWRCCLTAAPVRHPLCEALLFNTKAINRIGRVEDGNTVSDYEPEEVKRGGSIQTTLISCSWDRYKVNLLDTPGYDDFFGEVVGALRVVEKARPSCCRLPPALM